MIKSFDINKKKAGFTVFDAPSHIFINTLASYLKEKNSIKLSKFSALVKASPANDCKQINADYIFYKAAAICRKLYIIKSKNLGVGSLRSKFSNKAKKRAITIKNFQSRRKNY